MKVKELLEKNPVLLPTVVVLDHELAVRDGPTRVTLTKKDWVVLLFATELKRLRVRDEEGKTSYLPYTCKQLFELLPSDPYLDGKTFTSVTEVIRSSPAPKLMRCNSDYCSANKSGSVFAGEVLKVEGCNQDQWDQYLLCVNEAGEKLQLSSQKCTASFSAHLSATPVHVTKLEKLGFPQRILYKSERSGEEAALYVVEEIETRNQVVGVSSKVKKVMTISDEVSVSPIDVKDDLTKSVLAAVSALFRSLNTTYNVVQVPYCSMPTGIEGVPQPIDDVLKVWSQSYEAGERVRNIEGKSISELDREIRLLEGEVDNLTKKLAESTSDLSSKPEEKNEVASLPLLRVNSHLRPSLPTPRRCSSPNEYLNTIKFTHLSERNSEPCGRAAEKIKDLKAGDEQILATLQQKLKEAEKLMEDHSKIHQEQLQSLRMEFTKLKPPSSDYDAISKFPNEEEHDYSTIEDICKTIGRPGADSLAMKGVEQILKELSLTKYEKRFQKIQISVDTLRMMSEKDLQDQTMMSKSDAKKLLNFIK